MLRKIFKTATWKQSRITITGSIINGALGAIFYIILARILGPSDFGLLTVSITVLTFIGDFTDFGTNTGLVRFVSSSLVFDKARAVRFLKLSLEIKIFVWILVLLLGLYFAPLFAVGIFNKEELITPLRLVMVGVGGATLFSFATSALQATQKYFVWSTVNVATNFLRVALIGVLFYFGNLTLQSSLLSYIILPFFGFSLALLFLPVKSILAARNEESIAKELLKYNLGVALFSFIASVSGRLDTFLTARILTSDQVGIYGAANQLVAVVPQVISALGVVAAPKFSSFANNGDMLSYLKKFQLFVLGLCIIAIVAIPFVVYIIPLIFGPSYLSVTTPFVILLIAMLIFLFSIPVHTSVIYYFGRPDVFIWVSIGHLLIIGLLGYFLILNFGIIGAAISVLVGTSFNFIAPFLWFLFRLKKKENI